jgi:hypothetical protein
MGPAAAVVSVGIATLLGRQLLGALSTTRGQAQRSKRSANSADARARQAERDARSAADKLKKAVEAVRREEGRSERPPAPPEPPAKAKKDPPIYDVKIEEAVIKPRAAADAKPSKKQLAETFYAYVVREVRAGRSSGLGTKGHPNTNVADGQRAMGGLTVDGIYGEKTRGRGKELTGKSWPKREAAKAAAPVVQEKQLPPPPPVVKAEAKPAPKAQAQTEKKPVVTAPTRRTPVQAATELLAYARSAIGSGKGSMLGDKDRPSETVRLAQAEMGELKADGQYGPATRARGKALTGQTFPARV